MASLQKIIPRYKKDVYQSDFPAKGTRLVYGTSGLGGVWGKVDPGESIDCLLYAWENGITAVDTAPSYSHAEEYLGKALKRWTGERPFISSKVGRLQAEGAYDFSVDYSKEGMINSVRESLDLLGVDQLDLLFLHEPQLVPLDKAEEIFDTLRYIKEEGFTKMLGIGGNPTDQFRPYIKSDIFQAVSGFCKMDACNLSAFEKDIPYCLENNISYYAASALHFSLLGNRFEAYRKDPPEVDHITNRDINVAISINQIAAEEGMPLSTMAQRYLFSIEQASRVVIGARNIRQIQNSILDWKQGALPEKLFLRITDAIVNPVPE